MKRLPLHEVVWAVMFAIFFSPFVLHAASHDPEEGSPVFAKVRDMIEESQQLIAAHPQAPNGYFYQASAFFILRDYKAVLKTCRLAETRGAVNSALYELLAKTFFKLGDPIRTQDALILMEQSWRRENGFGP